MVMGCGAEVHDEAHEALAKQKASENENTPHFQEAGMYSSSDTFTHVGGHSVSTKHETQITHIGSEGTQIGVGLESISEPALLNWLSSHDADVSTLVEWLSTIKEWVPAQTGDVQANLLKLDDRIKELEKPKDRRPEQILVGKSEPVISQSDVKALAKHLGDKHDDLSSKLELGIADIRDTHDILREKMATQKTEFSDYLFNNVKYKKNLNLAIGFLYVTMTAMLGGLGYMAYVQFH